MTSPIWLAMIALLSLDLGFAQVPSKVDQELDTILTQEERKLVIYPVETDDAIVAWCRTIIGTESDELRMAQRVFDALLAAKGPRRRQDLAAMAAPEALKAMREGRDLDCEGKTYLYVAALRSLGISATVAEVFVDGKGLRMEDDLDGNHVCAVVQIGSEQLLVDTTTAYGAFRVAHREWRRLNEVQIIAFHMASRALDASSDKTRAARYGRIALKLDPSSFFCHVVSAYDDHLQRNYDTAIEKLRSALSIRPRSAWARAALARAHISARQNDTALQLSAEALDLHPRNRRLVIEVLIGKASAELNLGQYRDAIGTCNRVLRMDRENALAKRIRDLAMSQLPK